MTQNATKGYIGSDSLNKGYSNPKSTGKGYLRKGYIAAILPALWVMGCNSGSTTTSIVPLQGVEDPRQLIDHLGHTAVRSSVYR